MKNLIIIFLVANAFNFTSEHTLAKRSKGSNFNPLKANLSKLTRKDFIKVHKLYLDLFQKMEEKSKFPPYRPSKYSYLKKSFKNFSDFFINNAYAQQTGSSHCILAGWLSEKLDGTDSCVLPYYREDYAKKKGRNVYGPACRDGTPEGKFLFRCNPVLFGPAPSNSQIASIIKGKDEWNTKQWKNSRGVNPKNKGTPKDGLCVSTKVNKDQPLDSITFIGITKKCRNRSKELDKHRGQSWLQAMDEDKFKDYYDNEFRLYQDKINQFCNNDTTSPYDLEMCNSLTAQMAEILKRASDWGLHPLKNVVLAVDQLNSSIIEPGQHSTEIKNNKGGKVSQCTGVDSQQDPTTMPIFTQSLSLQLYDDLSTETKIPPEIDQEKYNKIIKSKNQCIDPLPEGNMDALFDALSALIANKSCKNIQSIHVGKTKAFDVIEKNPSCSILFEDESLIVEDNKTLNKANEGFLHIITNDNSTPKIVPWKISKEEMSKEDWLVGTGINTGFYDNDDIVSLCSGTSTENTPTLTMIEPVTNDSTGTRTAAAAQSKVLPEKEITYTQLDNVVQKSSLPQKYKFASDNGNTVAVLRDQFDQMHGYLFDKGRLGVEIKDKLDEIQNDEEVAYVIIEKDEDKKMIIKIAPKEQYYEDVGKSKNNFSSQIKKIRDIFIPAQKRKNPTVADVKYEEEESGKEYLNYEFNIETPTKKKRKEDYTDTKESGINLTKKLTEQKNLDDESEFSVIEAIGYYILIEDKHSNEIESFLKKTGQKDSTRYKKIIDKIKSSKDFKFMKVTKDDKGYHFEIIFKETKSSADPESEKKEIIKLSNFLKKNQIQEVFALDNMQVIPYNIGNADDALTEGQHQIRFKGLSKQLTFDVLKKGLTR